MVSSNEGNDVEPPGRRCVPSPRYCESEVGKRLQSEKVLKEESGANALSVAAREEEVAGKSEVVSRRWLVSVVGNDNARSQLIGWLPR
jgi:hypothetical protein